jgi:hypothetical protein
MQFSTWETCSCNGEIDWQAVLNGKPQSQDLDQWICEKALPGYIDALKQADWHYEFADDPRAYGAGARQIASLKETAKMSPGHQIAFNRAYCAAFPSAPPPWPFPGMPNEFPTPATELDGITKNNATNTDNKRMKNAIAIILVIILSLIEAGKTMVTELKSLAASGGDEPAPKKKVADDDDDTPPKKKKPAADDDDTPPKKKKVADDDDTPPKKKKVADDDDDTPPKKKKLTDDDDDDTEITYPMVKKAVAPLVEADEALAEKGKKEIHVQRVFDLLAKKPYEVEKITELKPAQYARFIKDVKALVEDI